MAFSEVNWDHIECAVKALDKVVPELERVAIVFTNLQTLAVSSDYPFAYEGIDWVDLAVITCRSPLAVFDNVLRRYRSALIWVPGAAVRLEKCRYKVDFASYCLWFSMSVERESLDNPLTDAVQELKNLIAQLLMYADAMGNTALIANCSVRAA